MILAIDPGNTHSAFCYLSLSDFRPIYFGKVENRQLLSVISQSFPPSLPCAKGGGGEADGGIAPTEAATPSTASPRIPAAIEMIASYGMPVGREVFDTCVWIGRFAHELERTGHPVSFVYRREVKLELCQSAAANDSNIRRALIDRFALHDFKSGKGTKKNPDWFYGFHADVWAAYAVGVTYLSSTERSTHNAG